jgi:hypothetical protein
VDSSADGDTRVPSDSGQFCNRLRRRDGDCPFQSMCRRRRARSRIAPPSGSSLSGENTGPAGASPFHRGRDFAGGRDGTADRPNAHTIMPNTVIHSPTLHAVSTLLVRFHMEVRPSPSFNFGPCSSGTNLNTRSTDGGSCDAPIRWVGTPLSSGTGSSGTCPCPCPWPENHATDAIALVAAQSPRFSSAPPQRGQTISSDRVPDSGGDIVPRVVFLKMLTKGDSSYGFG